MHQQGFHVAHGFFPTVKDSLGNNGVTNIELRQPRQGGNRLDVAVVQAMTRIHTQTLRHTLSNTGTDTFQFAGGLLGRLSIRISAGVQFNHGSAHVAGGTDLRRVGINEQRNTNAGGLQLLHSSLDLVQMTDHIQTTFGSQFSTVFGNQADIVRFDTAGNVQHFGGDGAFQIHPGTQYGAQGLDVGILNMTPVFTQM